MPMKYLIHKICFICLGLALSVIALAQGYDTTCSVNVMGHLQCNTRPDVITQSNNFMRELDLLEAERRRLDPCHGNPYCMPTTPPISPPPPVGHIESIPGAGALNQQLLQLQIQQMQQQQLQQQQLQSGVLKRSFSQGGRVFCQYVPLNNGKFFYRGAYHDSMSYSIAPGQTKCGQRLQMASDGRGWMQ